MFRAGLDFQVGAAGKRLTQVQRQKLAVARALLKRPDIAILNRSLGALDQKSQRTIIERVVESAAADKMGLFCVLTSPMYASLFDRVLVFEDGTIVEDGSPKALAAKESSRYRALAGA